MLSTANEYDSNCSIEEMGLKLAKEIKSFISDWCPSQKLSKYFKNS